MYIYNTCLLHPTSSRFFPCGALCPVDLRCVWDTSHIRDTSHMRKHAPKGPYRRSMPRILGGSWEGGRCFIGEVPLYLLVRGVPATLKSRQLPSAGIISGQRRANMARIRQSRPHSGLGSQANVLGTF